MLGPVVRHCALLAVLARLLTHLGKVDTLLVFLATAMSVTLAAAPHLKMEF